MYIYILYITAMPVQLCDDIRAGTGMEEIEEGRGVLQQPHVNEGLRHPVRYV
jgi:hypothetical protein